MQRISKTMNDADVLEKIRSDYFFIEAMVNIIEKIVDNFRSHDFLIIDKDLILNVDLIDVASRKIICGMHELIDVVGLDSKLSRLIDCKEIDLWLMNSR